MSESSDENSPVIRPKESAFLKQHGVSILKIDSNCIVKRCVARNNFGRGIRITLPDENNKAEDHIHSDSSRIIYFPWPDSVPIAKFPECTEYHKVSLGVQPRHTLCYEATYKYSGLLHPVEKVTPPDIKAIIEYTKKTYDIGDDVLTMCLANRYTTDYHCIGKHSDDESQFCDIRDVVCWVTGKARRIIIRDKKKNEIVLSIVIPQGVYIMRGDKFQSRYTHEIPRENVSLFDKLSVIAPNELSKLEKADWLSEHASKVKRKHPDLYERYKEWNQERCSYTIRFFCK